MAINKNFVFHLILMKLGEIVVHMGNYNFTKATSSTETTSKKKPSAVFVIVLAEKTAEVFSW